MYIKTINQKLRAVFLLSVALLLSLPMAGQDVDSTDNDEENTSENKEDTLSRSNLPNPTTLTNLFKEVTVKTPEMGELVKSIVYPINYSTGQPEIVIPLYEVRCGSLSLPISLSFRSSGIMVNDDSGWVGQNWKLIAEPMITRAVKGKEDLASDSYHCDFTPNSNHMASYAYNYSINGNPRLPDEYYYHLSGKDGMFMYCMNPIVDLSESFLSMPYDNVKITNTSGVFRISDDEGVLYTFNGAQDEAVGTNVSHTCGWKASSMISANLCDTINFTYYTGSQRYQTFLLTYEDNIQVIDQFDRLTDPNQTDRYNGTWLSDFDMRSPVIYSTIKGTTNSFQLLDNGTFKNDGGAYTPVSGEIYNTTYSSQIKKISFRGGSVEFSLGEGSRLSEITVKDIQNHVVRTILLNYTTTSHSRAFLTELIIQGASSDKREIYQFSYQDIYNVPETGNRSIDYWGYYNGRYRSYSESMVPQQVVSTARTIGGSSIYMTIGSAVSRESDETAMKYGSLASITYPTGGKDVFLFEANKVRRDDNSIVPVGGLRIQKIVSVENGDTVNARTFKYGIDESGAGISRVEESDWTDYFLNTVIKYYDEVGGKSAIVRTYSASPVFPITHDGGSSVMYDYVTEYHGSSTQNSGKTVYKYKINSTKYSATDNFYYSIRNSWLYGQLLEKIVYNCVGDTLERTVNSYNESQTIGKICNEYSYYGAITNGDYYDYNHLMDGTADFEPLDDNVTYYDLVSSTTERYDAAGSVSQLVTTYSRNLPKHSFVTSETTTGTDQKTYTTSYTYPEQQSGSPYTDMITRNVVSPVYSTTYERGSDVVIKETPYNTKYQISGVNANYNSEGMTNRISYLYDSHANRVQAIKDNKEKVTYLYGYNNQYVIAVIENAEYSAVNTALGNAATTIAAAAQPSTANWTSINGLRSSHPEWHITTYKWQPLVGVISMTDPAGIETRYTYDGLGRLTRKSQIIDNSETIIEEYEYHYKTE